jgi:polysaccharide export outer membrane protein
MRIFRTVMMMAAVLAASVLSSGLPVQDQVLSEKFVTEYKIGPKDVLEIKVVGQDKMTTVARVSEEGKISFWILGEISVDGLTAPELEKKLAQLLEKDYLQNPKVLVNIQQHQSKRVSVLGSVQKPGFVELLGRQSLLEVIVAAGGLTKDAAKEILILRLQPDGSSARLAIPIEDLMLKGDPKYNIPIEPNDTIIVQTDQLVSIYIYGQVKSPGALQVFKSRLPALTQAIAQAGGFTDRAALGGVVIKRKDEKGNELNITMNVRDIQKGKRRDFPLMENDVIFVPESWI